jgi:DNA repair exonuclease SbcCD nuclease subunit
MHFRFLHMADCHLGYRQYNLRERFNDFGQAFHDVIHTAIAEKVDFVLLAGDLFQKRAIDALTLNQAIVGLERLRAAGIPCIAVEGNHEHAYYDDYIGWMKFLAVRQLLVLLDPEHFEAGRPQLKAYTRPNGSYIDPLPGVRIHGLRYLGASTGRVLESYAAALQDLPLDGIEYSIFLTHAGVEGELAEEVGGLTMRQLAPLRSHADYVALGHIHKPFERDNWVYNPGSLETCSTLEAQWPNRGYYLVDVDTSRGEGPKHVATLHANPRRRFVSVSLKVDTLLSPEHLYDECRSFLTRKARDFGLARLQENERPVVALNLNGVLPFDRAALNLAQLEELVRECCTPLHVMVHNFTHSAEYAVEAGETLSRPVLERQVLARLFDRDARFRDHSQAWARAALSLKTLVLDGAEPQAVVDELEARMAAIEQEGKAADDVDSGS